MGLGFVLWIYTLTPVWVSFRCFFIIDTGNNFFSLKEQNCKCSEIRQWHRHGLTCRSLWVSNLTSMHPWCPVPHPFAEGWHWGKGKSLCGLLGLWGVTFTAVLQKGAAAAGSWSWAVRFRGAGALLSSLKCTLNEGSSISLQFTLHFTEARSVNAVVFCIFLLCTEIIHQFILEQQKGNRVPLCINPQSAAFKSFIR